MLALLLVATPRSLRVGFIAAAWACLWGLFWVFCWFLGGWVDAVIQVLADAFITIPSLAVLIVIAALVNQITIENHGPAAGLVCLAAANALRAGAGAQYA